jgi:hypothetical protein
MKSRHQGRIVSGAGVSMTIGEKNIILIVYFFLPVRILTSCYFFS